MSSRQAFNPRAWFLIFFVFFFAVPTFISLWITRESYGIGYLAFDGWRIAFLTAFAICVAFAVISYAVSFVIPRSRPDPVLNATPPRRVSKVELQVGWLLFIVGIFPTLALIGQFSGDTRSQLVSGLFGQVLFALSYALLLGYMCIAISYLERRRFVLFILLTLVFAALLFVLGGRGRVIWPVLSVFVTYQIIKSPTLQPFRIGALLGLLFVAGSLMDPVLAIYYGRSGVSLLDSLNIQTLLTEVFIVRRNFDSFYNFFVIYYFDDIPHSLSYLVSGPRNMFMATYFPQVLDRGIGFPATVPGTFWMVAGLGGVIVGAVFFGLLIGVLARFYNRTQSALWLGFQIYLYTWILNTGLSLFDNMAKIFAILMLLIPFWFLPKLAREVATKRSSAAIPRPSPT